jgi:hypothetical protein
MSSALSPDNTATRLAARARTFFELCDRLWRTIPVLVRAAFKPEWEQTLEAVRQEPEWLQTRHRPTRKHKRPLMKSPSTLLTFQHSWFVVCGGCTGNRYRAHVLFCTPCSPILAAVPPMLFATQSAVFAVLCSFVHSLCNFLFPHTFPPFVF